MNTGIPVGAEDAYLANLADPDEEPTVKRGSRFGEWEPDCSIPALAGTPLCHGCGPGPGPARALGIPETVLEIAQRIERKGEGE